MPLRSTSVTMAPSWISTPIFSSRACAFLPSFSPIGARTAGSGVEQDHPRRGRIDVPERAFERVVGEFGDLPGHFDARRACADDGERQQLLPTGRIAGALGLLERPENPGPQLQRVVDRLHAGRPLGEMVVAEVRLAGACGDDQAVVRGDVRVAEQLRGDGFAREVDVGGFAEQHLGVLLLAQDHPGRRRDLTGRDDAGRHLVQQRLEQVVGGLGDHLDIDVGALERLGGGQPAEPRSDDDDFVPVRCSGSGIAHFRAPEGLHVQFLCPQR